MLETAIPQEKSAAVSRGLREAFGVTAVEDIRGLTISATSDLVYRIVAGGTAYVLRIIRRAKDSECHFTCMRAAAEAGLAPRIWYSSVADGVAITDWVERVPFSVAEGRVRMPVTLRALHALPRFPGRADHLNTSCRFLINRGSGLDGFIQSFQAANLMPARECEEIFARYAELTAVYPLYDVEMVSSHNDLKPENLCFDGERVWLLDWEAAFLNDRYADLAVMANFLVTNEAEEEDYLLAYFGQAPDDYQRARFFLMRQVAHLFYAMAYLLTGSRSSQVDLSEKAPDYVDFHRRNWSGEIKFEGGPMRIAYGRTQWERLLENVRTARFREAVRIVGEASAP